MIVAFAHKFLNPFELFISEVNYERKDLNYNDLFGFIRAGYTRKSYYASKVVQKQFGDDKIGRILSDEVGENNKGVVYDFEFHKMEDINEYKSLLYQRIEKRRRNEVSPRQVAAKATSLHQRRPQQVHQTSKPSLNRRNNQLGADGTFSEES